MSYKKFSRYHGRTERIKRYKWSNPDHPWRGEVGLKSNHSSSYIIGVPILRGGYYGSRRRNINHLQLRHMRRYMNRVVNETVQLTDLSEVACIPSKKFGYW